MQNYGKSADWAADKPPQSGGGSFYNGGYGYMPGPGMYPGDNMFMGPPFAREPEAIVVTKLFSSRRDLDRMASGVDFPHLYKSEWDIYNLGTTESGMMRSQRHSDASIGRKGSGVTAKTANGVGATGADANGKVSATTRKAPAAADTAVTRDAAASATTGTATARANGGVPPPPQPSSATTVTVRPAPVRPPASNSSNDSAKQSPARPPSPGATADFDLYSRNRRTSHNTATDLSQVGLASQPSSTNDIPQLRSEYVASGSAYGQLGGSAMNRSADMSLFANDYSTSDIKERTGPVGAPNFHPSQPSSTTTRQDARRPSATHKPDSAPSRLSIVSTAIPLLAGGAGNATSLYDAGSAVSQRQPVVLTKDHSTVHSVAEPPPPHTPAAAQESPRVSAGTAATRPAAATTTASPAPRPGSPAHGRSSSRRASRPVSRLTSMNLIEFPQGEEVVDEVGQSGLADPQHERELEERKMRLESARAEVRTSRMKEREAAQAAERAAQQRREEQQQQRREQRAREEQQRREAVAALDEERRERREAELAARELQREAEKRRFLEAAKAEEEREAARVQAILQERQKRLEEEEENGTRGEGDDAGRHRGADAHSRTGNNTSRPRSRLRPPSRPTSVLRGAIPEQPPDVVGGQMEDTLADELATAKEKSAVHAPHRRSGTPVAATSHPPPPSPPPTVTVEAETPAATPTPPPPPVVVAQASSVAHASSAAEGSARRSASGTTSKSVDTRPAEDTAKTTPAPQDTATKAVNRVRTILVEGDVAERALCAHEPDSTTVRYGEAECTVSAVVKELPGCAPLKELQKVACEGFNTAILGVEAPSTTSRFDSPVWQALVQLVGKLLRHNSDEEGHLNANFDLTCALGYLLKEQVKDLFNEDDASPFENVSVHPSPIYGPRIKQLVYSQVTSLDMFDAYLHTALKRAQANPAVSELTEGVVVAFVLVKQSRLVKDVQDVFLSSIMVASAGADPVPYESACSRARNVYGAVFHLVLGGPCLTCFTLNAAVDKHRIEDDAEAQQTFAALYQLTQRLASFENYSLRSGSVRRFIRYVEQAQNQLSERLRNTSDEAQRKKLEHYKAEQHRLLTSALKMLDEATLNNVEEL